MATYRDGKIEACKNLSHTYDELEEVSRNLVSDVCKKYSELLVRAFKEARKDKCNICGLAGGGHRFYYDGKEIRITDVELGKDDRILLKYTNGHGDIYTVHEISFIELVKGAQMPYFSQGSYCMEQAKDLVDCVIRTLYEQSKGGEYEVYLHTQMHFSFNFPLPIKYNTKSEHEIRGYINQNADKLIDEHKEEFLNILRATLTSGDYGAFSFDVWSK